MGLDSLLEAAAVLCGFQVAKAVKAALEGKKLWCLGKVENPVEVVVAVVLAGKAVFVCRKVEGGFLSQLGGLYLDVFVCSIGFPGADVIAQAVALGHRGPFDLVGEVGFSHFDELVAFIGEGQSLPFFAQAGVVLFPFKVIGPDGVWDGCFVFFGLGFRGGYRPVFEGDVLLGFWAGLGEAGKVIFELWDGGEVFLDDRYDHFPLEIIAGLVA